MDSKTVGLAIALTYPGYAFSGAPPQLIEEAEALVAGARRDQPYDPEVRAFLRQHQKLNEWIEQLLEDPDLVPPELRAHAGVGFRNVAGFEERHWLMYEDSLPDASAA